MTAFERQEKRPGLLRQEDNRTAATSHQLGQLAPSQSTAPMPLHVYEDGRRAGRVEGERQGFLAGYTHGLVEGIRNSEAFRAGVSDGYAAGYMDALADRRAEEGS